MVDLRPDQLATVLAILSAEVPECEVWAFGSRAKWTAKDSSDLDLALVASERLPLPKLGRLREAFKDSYLSVKVDVVDIHRVSDEFRKIIENQKVVLQKPLTPAVSQTDRTKWQTLPLEECLETLIDYRGKTPKKVSCGIPLITAKVVKNGRIETPDEFIAEEDYEGWMRRGFPQAGDVLLTMEAPLGEVAQLDDRKVALAQRLVALRGKRGLLDNSYLKYLLQSDVVQDQLRSRATGTTVLGIKQSELRKINLTLPPLDEQRAMAQVLGSLDDKIELNRQMNETLEALARSLFKSWFVDFDPVRGSGGHFQDSAIGPIPKGWKVQRFDQHITVDRGLSYKGEGLREDGTGLPMHNLNSVYEGGGYKHEGIKYYAGEYRENHLLQPGDMIVANTEQGFDHLLIGHAAIVPKRYGPQGLFSHHIYRVRQKPTSPFNPHYLVELFNSRRWHYWISGFSNGTTINMLPKDALEMPLLVLPPDELVKKFTSLAEATHAKLEANFEESRTLAALRDALLPKLLSGELRVPQLQG